MPAKPRKGRRWPKYVLISLGTIVGLLIIGYVVRIQVTGKSDENDEFELSKVERGDVTTRLTETGTTYLERTIEVMSKVSGTVTLTAVEEGDIATKGQVLAVVEPDNTELLGLYGKRGQVATAYIRMVQAADDLSHAQKLFNAIGGTSQDDVLRKQRSLSTARTDFRLSLMELHILEKDMEIANGMAKKVAEVLRAGTESDVRKTMDDSLEIFEQDSSEFFQLADVRVLAPGSGIIIEKGIEVGEMIISGTSALSRGTMLFKIGDPESMSISCLVSEVDAGKLHVNQRADITFEAYPDEKQAGKIVWISPIGTRPEGASIISFQVKLELDEAPDFAKPGMSCDIDIVTDEKKDVLIALLESVGEEDEKAYVYVKSKDGYEKKEIEVGIKDDRHWEITSGLEEEEEIVTDFDECDAAQQAKEDEDVNGKKGRRRKGNVVV